MCIYTIFNRPISFKINSNMICPYFRWIYWLGAYLGELLLRYVLLFISVQSSRAL